MNGTPESQKSGSAQSAKVPISTNTGSQELTQEKVRALFDYYEGELVRKGSGGGRRSGSVAGYHSALGYVVIRVGEKIYKAHRLVWLWHHGYMPENQIDHINRERADNRIENLREAGRVCNARNTGNHRNNTSGVKGVHWAVREKKWVAYISVGGKLRNLGSHDDFLEAVCHRLAAEQFLNWAGCDDCSPAYQYVLRNMA